MSATWMIRAGEAGYLVDDFRKKGIVAVGWSDIGDLSRVGSKESLRKLVEETYDEWSPGRQSQSAAALWKFLKDVKSGDKVLSYDTAARDYIVGEVTGPYGYDPKLIEGYPHVHPVKWTGSVSRDALSVPAKNSLGAIQTFFNVAPEIWNELNRLLRGEKPDLPEKEEAAELETLKEDIEGRAREFIIDRIQSLSWDQMQEFVAGLLRAMGYKTIVSPKGADRGKDIIASPDGLGLENPRIRVEVKHRNQQIGAPDIRSFIAALRPSDKGLYVSSGGFTNEAHYEAERSNVPVTLVDLARLAHLLDQHYERADMATRSLVPLVRVYWPVDIKTG